MIRRGISNTNSLRSTSWCLANRFLSPVDTISNVNNMDKTIENTSVGVNGNRSYSSGGVGLPSYMRAAVFREPNKPLTIEEFQIPRPKAGEVLIKTKGRCLYIFIFLTLLVFFCLWDLHLMLFGCSDEKRKKKKEEVWF